MESLAASGEFAPPSLESLEAAQEYGLSLRAGRVSADLWDIEAFTKCPACSVRRAERIRAMNATQVIPPPLRCDRCDRCAELG